MTTKNLTIFIRLALYGTIDLSLKKQNGHDTISISFKNMYKTKCSFTVLFFNFVLLSPIFKQFCT